MKSAQTTPATGGTSRRAQPARQARQKPSRTPLRPFTGTGSVLRNGQLPDQNIDIFPAITSFTDAVSALPRELVRHFTLLKEVDAKICHPEEHLHRLVDAALNTPLPDILLQQELSCQRVGVNMMSGTVIGSGVMNNSRAESIATTVEQDAMTAAMYHQSNMPRRQLFRQCTVTMSEMLVSLDEKNHVLSTANDALTKQLRRMDDLYPHIENELSEEAKYGSLTHWAYSDNRSNKSTDRGRPVITKEAQQQIDEAAARSEARQQAMHAKKGRNNQMESDLEESTKKPHGNTKKGRPADLISSSGPGISNNSPTGPTTKRRKVEKGTFGGAVMERSNSALGVSNSTAKAKQGSPRDTIPLESKKKSVKSANMDVSTKRRTTLANANIKRAAPALTASSPLHSTPADARSTTKASPALTNGRPTGRGRQNSTQSVITSASSTSRGKGLVDTSTHLVGLSKANGTPDLATVAGVTGRSIAEVKTTMKESANNSKGEHMIEDIDQEEPELKGGLVVGNRKELDPKDEDVVPPTHDEIPVISQVVTVSKTGKLGKSQAVYASNSHDAIPRSRSTRVTSDTNISGKRSHKKGASITTNTPAELGDEADGPANEEMGEEDENGDADEPTYCYCNNISYGEMVACDNDACTKEWFHLECAGLDKAPVGKAKWYCNECKEIMKNSKRFNVR